MEKRVILSILVAILLASPLWSQDFSDCELDFYLAKQQIEPQRNDFQSGLTVRLSEQYLKAVEKNIYGQKISGMSYYAYVRPASNREIKSGLLPDQHRQIMSDDGNVYGLRATKGNEHFFRPGDLFRGDYRPEWHDPELILPMGLEPIEIADLTNQNLVILDKQPEFILLEADGQHIVFYPGYPEAEEAFDTRESLQAIQ
ncbi:MAG: hypothetical protein AAF206_04495 [Bacteroidota bacterium]